MQRLGYGDVQPCEVVHNPVGSGSATGPMPGRGNSILERPNRLSKLL
jgi:hypothetical protein